MKMKTSSSPSNASINPSELYGQSVHPERANYEDEIIIEKLILSNKILFIKNQLYDIFMRWYKQNFQKRKFKYFDIFINQTPVPYN